MSLVLRVRQSASESSRSDDAARLQAVLKDPMFADIDLPSFETGDAATNFPGVTEALLRLYTAYQEEQLALADRTAEAHATGGGAEAPDPVAEGGVTLSRQLSKASHAR